MTTGDLVAGPVRVDLSRWRRMVWPATWVLGVASTLMTVSAVLMGRGGMDAHAYWSAWRVGLYTVAPGQLGAFLYSPAFAHAIRPLTWLPWPVFWPVWAATLTAAFAWLLAPLGWRRALPLLLLVAPEIMVGNVYALFAVVIVVGARYPAAWAFPLLAKVTPAVGVVWFAVRRELRSLAWSLGAAAVLAGLSFAAAPELWHRWVAFMLSTHSTGQIVFLPFYARLPAALVLTVWGARTGRTWVLPVAMILASPVFGLQTFTILTALPRLTARCSEPVHAPVSTPSCKPQARRAAQHLRKRPGSTIAG